MNQQITEFLKNFEMPELVHHSTAESIFNEHWNFEKDLSFEELLQSKCADDETLETVFEQTKENGFWAFMSLNDNRVHVWMDPAHYCNETLFFLIGHEIGHRLQEHFQSKLSKNEFKEYMRNESNADLWGVGALFTYRLVQTFIKSFGDQKEEKKCG